MNNSLPHAPAEFIVLHSRASSVVLETHADEAPIWRYWGPRLSDGATPRLPLRDTRPLPSFMLEFDQPLTLVPSFGVGWFGQSALLAHRDGQQFAQAFNRCEVQWLGPARAVALHLTDTTAALRFHSWPYAARLREPLMSNVRPHRLRYRYAGSILNSTESKA